MESVPNDSEPADADLLRRLSSDPAAFEVFYRRHVDRVVGFAARRVSQPADAADLVAATFVTVLTAARSYDPERGEPGAWLLGITARLIANARRRKVRESAALARIAGGRLIDQTDIDRLEERIDAARSSQVTAHRTVSITVNYRNRTWSTVTYPFGSATSARTPGPLPQTPLQQAAQLRAQVKAGQVTDTGRATVDGQTAIHLTEHLAGGLINLWVSPTSYLPIREIDTAAGVPLTSDKAIRDDYRWLPATAANLHLITGQRRSPPASPRSASITGADRAGIVSGLRRLFTASL